MIITAFIPLLLGGILYYYLFPDALFVSFLDRFWKAGVHSNYLYFRTPFLSFVRNYLLDCLWAFSFCNFLFLITENDSRKKWIVFLIPASVGIVLEVLQKVGAIMGIFDIWDIVVEIIGVFVALMVTRLYQEDIYEKN
ncbi:MAG: hypothetical protein J6X36_08125 [Lachnospiraceae bacterium]|nr:hypothetical protein [Lachnospiraceae bacterium]